MSRNGNGKSAVIYARVSSREQKEEGYSIDAQLKLLRKYAQENGITVSQEYTDAETAKESGRTSFGLMLDALQAVPEKERVILVEKTDRLYRNIYDWVKVDQLRPVIHFVKDGYVLSDDSRSNEKFIHGIKALMAKNYVDNLSEEVKKGQLEKAEQGTFPGKAPLGYSNVVADGKHRIDIDPHKSVLVRRLFEKYASGDCSLTELTGFAREIGLRSCNDKIMPRSAVYALLQNIFYTGRFVWKGREYEGDHTPLVSNELFQRVQQALKKDGKPDYRTKREFPFIGLVKCAHCGCAVTAEIKKGKYVYYHCTGFRGGCDKPYIREEELDKLLVRVVRDARVDEDTALLIRDALREGHRQERQIRQMQIAEITRRLERVRQRLDRIYEDKLDGKIDEELWARKRSQYTEEINSLERQQADAKREHGPFYESVERIIELAEAAPRLWSAQVPHERARLLRILLSNCTFDGENLHPDYRKPFCWLAKMQERPISLGRMDSNHRSRLQRPLPYHLATPQ